MENVKGEERVRDRMMQFERACRFGNASDESCVMLIRMLRLECYAVSKGMSLGGEGAEGEEEEEADNKKSRSSACVSLADLIGRRMEEKWYV